MTAVDAQPAPGEADLTRICAIEDRVIRNLEITECYARLSEAMRDRTGALANWCTFATWASRQAGSTIRGEDLLEGFKRHLGEGAGLLAPFQAMGRALLRKGLFAPNTRLGAAVAVIHTPFDSFERASDAVARGNLKVFAEIGREFARYIHEVRPDAPVDSPAFEQFADGLRPGEPPEGQDYLKHAFGCYQVQGQGADPGARAALMLLANLKIGLHEQTRLQPQIAEAVEAPLVTAEDLGDRTLDALFPGSRRWPKLLHRPAAAALGWVARRLRTAASRLTREAVTDSLMVLALPGIVLPLGRDLDTPAPRIFMDTRHPELDGFISLYDPCAPGDVRCGATDWCDLRQRMHYILHLFRAYAEDATLFTPPFSPDQVRRFRDGIVPDGSL